MVTRWLGEDDNVDLLHPKLKCYGIAPSVINWVESFKHMFSVQVAPYWNPY